MVNRRTSLPRSRHLELTLTAIAKVVGFSLMRQNDYYSLSAANCVDLLESPNLQPKRSAVGIAQAKTDAATRRTGSLQSAWFGKSTAAQLAEQPGPQTCEDPREAPKIPLVEPSGPLVKAFFGYGYASCILFPFCGCLPISLLCSSLVCAFLPDKHAPCSKIQSRFCWRLRATLLLSLGFCAPWPEFLVW